MMLLTHDGMSSLSGQQALKPWHVSCTCHHHLIEEMPIEGQVGSASALSRRICITSPQQASFEKSPDSEWLPAKMEGLARPAALAAGLHQANTCRI